MIRGLIFDLDGVLFDSHPVHRKAWRGVLQKAGKHASEDELDFIMNGATREEILHHFFGPLTSEQIATYTQQKETFVQNDEHQVQTIAGVEAFLDLVESAKLPKAVATSASKARAERILEKHGMTTRFSAVITSDDVHKGKTDPAIFLRSAEKLGLAAPDVLVFEDAAPAIRSVKNIGMKCIGIATATRRPLLLGAGADLVFADFRELRLSDVMRLSKPLGVDSF
jgi:beta-phosphoglucomutase